MDTPLQACSITTKIHVLVTACSIYFSRNHALSEPLLQLLWTNEKVEEIPTRTPTAYKKTRKGEESWSSFVTTINEDTSISKVWESIRKIEGRQSRKFNILVVINKCIGSIQDISTTLANSFSRVSYFTNYNIVFQHRQ